MRTVNCPSTTSSLRFWGNDGSSSRHVASLVAMFVMLPILAGCSDKGSEDPAPGAGPNQDSGALSGEGGVPLDDGGVVDGGDSDGDGGATADGSPDDDASVPGPKTGPLAGLDPSGKTIPDTNYPIPAGAIFLATNGKDANAGTEAQPVATLDRALALVPSGGTVVVRGGLYRDWYTSGTNGYKIVTKPFTLQAYPHEQPWFDGTDVVDAAKWTSDGAGHWYMPWETPSFCDGGYYKFKYDEQPTTNSGPCSHFDMYGDPANPAAGDPQMVFIDGTYVHEVTSLAGATPGNFFYDWAAHRMYIATNPNGHTVELAARPVALVLGGSDYKIRGIGFKRYATNEYSNLTGGAVYVGAKNTTFEDCAFTQMAGGALSLQPQGGVLQHSVFANNGFTAVGGNGHSVSGVIDGLLIQNNIVSGNNAELYGTNCSVSCAQGGIKNAHLNQFTIRNNLFENNHLGSGYWCDTDCTGGVIVDNVARGNTVGIFLEMSDKSIIASNLAYDNTKTGIRVLAGNTKIYNNTTSNSATHDLWVYDDSRGPTTVVPNTVNLDIENNIFSNNGVTNVYASNSQTGPNTYITGLDYNSYYRGGGCGKPVFDWQDTTRVDYKSIAALTADHGWEAHAQDICTGGDPFFVDVPNRDYTVRASSVAYQSGKPLPADVAAALGVPAGSVFSRGAISWPATP